MEKIFVGKVINTHGIKGELKINTSFKYKEQVFVVGNKLYVDDYELVIVSVRNHKGCKLVCVEGYNNINDVLIFKGKNVYSDRCVIDSTCILPQDIIGLSVFVGTKDIGKVDNVISNGAHEIFVVGNVMIPFVDAFVYKIDFETKKIFVNEIEGLLSDED